MRAQHCSSPSVLGVCWARTPGRTITRLHEEHSHASPWPALLNHTPCARAAPQQYRYAECAGRVVGLETYLFSGCVPRDDAMVPFADFVAFLAARRAPAAVPAQGAPDQAASPAGRISHFIIWNEVRVWAPHPRLIKESCATPAA